MLAIHRISAFLILAFAISSCGALKDSSFDKGIQKRRYTKGYNLNLKTPNFLISKDEFRNGALESISSKPAMAAETHEPVLVQDHSRPETYAITAETGGNGEISIHSAESAGTHPVLQGDGLYDLDNVYASAPKQQMKSKQDVFGQGNRITPAGAFISFFLGLGSLVIFPIPLGIIATVLGMLSLDKISNSPEKYQGKGFAIFGILFGILSLLWGLYSLAVVT